MCLRAMKAVVIDGPQPQYLGASDVHYSFHSCGERSTPRISKKNLVDLSGNKFEGEIPNIICTLHSINPTTTLLEISLRLNHWTYLGTNSQEKSLKAYYCRQHKSGSAESLT
ncbi:hypothetical protein LXL04_033874 [Taraxacum kok-saghyz]